MGETMSDEELKEIIKEANKGNDDELSEEDFIKFMSKLSFDN
jgi:Ca2+-binding EF-hand superfamily protein